MKLTVKFAPEFLHASLLREFILFVFESGENVSSSVFYMFFPSFFFFHGAKGWDAEIMEKVGWKLKRI